MYILKFTLYMQIYVCLGHEIGGGGRGSSKRQIRPSPDRNMAISVEIYHLEITYRGFYIMDVGWNIICELYCIYKPVFYLPNLANLIYR